MEKVNIKYPRTFHLPYSPGSTKDDKKLQGNWFSYFNWKEIVITEKLDGENTAMTEFDVYARSHAAPTRSPWSLNLWDPNGGLFWDLKQYIGHDETIYGENLYGEHSIHYDKLNSYWHMFAVNNGENWYSWNDVETMAKIMNVPTVPVLWRGVVSSEMELKTLVDYYVMQPSVYGPTREGVVIRIADEFPIDEFSHYVCKWVRPNHVQTDEHWTRNWKKAQLIRQ